MGSAVPNSHDAPQIMMGTHYHGVKHLILFIVILHDSLRVWPDKHKKHCLLEKSSLNLLRVAKWCCVVLVSEISRDRQAYVLNKAITVWQKNSCPVNKTSVPLLYTVTVGLVKRLFETEVDMGPYCDCHYCRKSHTKSLLFTLRPSSDFDHFLPTASAWPASYHQ